MGKLVSFISILIFVDLLFLITGQLVITSPTSVFLQAILDPSSLQSSQIWVLFVTAGMATLTIIGSVVAGIVTRNVEFFFFVPIALGMVTMAGDFITIFLYLASLNIVLATVTLAPIIVLFVLVIMEWLRGKD